MRNRPTLDTLGDDKFDGIENRHQYKQMIYEVLKGEFFPKHAHLAMGSPLFFSTMQVDLDEWRDRAEKQLPSETCSEIEAKNLLRLCERLVKSDCDLEELNAAEKQLTGFIDLTDSVGFAILCSDLKGRMMFYRLHQGDPDALMQFFSVSFSRVSTYDDLLVLSFQHRAIDAFVGSGILKRRNPSTIVGFRELLNNADNGIEHILEDAYDLYKRLDDRAHDGDDDDEENKKEAEEKKSLSQMVAEAKKRNGNGERRSRKVGATAASTAGNREIAREFHGVLNGQLDIVQVGDVKSKFDALCRKFPHATDAIKAIFDDLSVANGDVRFRHTLFVGSPGCGKTQLAREIGKVLGINTTVYSCTGVTDGMFAGTPRGWASANPSIPVHALKAGQIANPLIILDELEKAGQSRRNGNLIETLLPFLERKQAQAIFDKALTAEVDLSYVNYIGTANDTMSIRGPLLDRMRVVHVPDPKPDHLGDLARSIIDGIAEEKGWHPDMIEPLDELEKAVIRKVWKGGSIRRLSVAITRLVEARDKIAQIH